MAIPERWRTHALTDGAGGRRVAFVAIAIDVADATCKKRGEAHRGDTAEADATRPVADAADIEHVAGDVNQLRP